MTTFYGRLLSTKFEEQLRSKSGWLDQTVFVHRKYSTFTSVLELDSILLPWSESYRFEINVHSDFS